MFESLAARVESRGFARIAASRLEWRRIDSGGNDSGPTLVFLHEGLGCAKLWRGFPDALVRRAGLGAFSYSRAGYGRSSPGAPLPLDYHHGEALEVLPRVLDAAGITRPILVGHSDGGTIALIYAAGWASVQAPPPLAVVTMAAHVFVEDETLRGIEAARAAFLNTDLRARLSLYHGDNVDGAFWGWCDAWLSPAFRDWNVEAVLRGIDCPLLVVQGRDDHYGTPAQVRAIAEGVAGPAETLLLAECGHAPHLEQPDRTLEAIATFLAAHNVP